MKPQILTAVCDEIAPFLKPRAPVLSIAAGVPVAVIEAHLPPGTRVVRVMPNTPALVGAGPPPSPQGVTPPTTTWPSPSSSSTPWV